MYKASDDNSLLSKNKLERAVMPHNNILPTLSSYNQTATSFGQVYAVFIRRVNRSSESVYKSDTVYSRIKSAPAFLYIPNDNNINVTRRHNTALPLARLVGLINRATILRKLADKAEKVAQKRNKSGHK